MRRDVIADDLLAAPLANHFLRVERIAVVDGAREILFGAIDAVRGEQFRGAQHAHVVEQLGADFVLPALAAVVLQVDGPQSHAVAEPCEHGIGLVVGMRGSLHEGAGHREFAQRQTERNVPGILSHQRERHARLRLHMDEAGLGKRDAQDGGAGGKYQDAFHGWLPRDALGVVYPMPLRE